MENIHRDNFHAKSLMGNEGILGLSLKQAVLGLLGLFIAQYAVKIIYKTFIWYPFLSYHKNLPGPARPSYIRGNLGKILESEPGVIHKAWREEHGTAMRYALFNGKERLMISDPKALNHMILGNSYAYPKPQEIRGELGRILGRGILFTEGDVHRNQKKTLSPAFNGPNVNALLPIFNEKAHGLRRKLTDVIEKASSTYSGDVVGYIGLCTLDIIGAAGLGAEFNTLEAQAHPLSTSFAEMFARPMPSGFLALAGLFLFINFPMLQHLPTKRTRAIKTSMATMRSECGKLLREAQAEARLGDRSTSKDLLSLLVKANMSGDDKSRLTDEEVMGQVSQSLTALTWCMLELSRNQDVQQKLRQEIRQAKLDNGLDTADSFSVEQLNALPYLDAVMREILRMRPPVPNTIRQASQDDDIPLATPVTLKNGTQINSVQVKAGDEFFIPLLVINTLPSIWGPDADKFRPERWLSKLPESVGQATQGFSIYSNLFTFLGGPRACIGYRFALLEFKSILSTMIETIQVDPHDVHKDIIGKSFIVTRPFIKDDKSEKSSLPLKLSMAA